MTEMDDITDWRALREFAGVDLTRSFVLSWEIVAGTLVIDTDLCLTPAHPFYEKPRPAQRDCISAAVIEFPLFAALRSDRLADAIDPASALRQIGHGAIKGLSCLADGEYELSGDFGVVLIDAERPLLRIKTS
jgi:hypothetical protein